MNRNKITNSKLKICKPKEILNHWIDTVAQLIPMGVKQNVYTVYYRVDLMDLFFEVLAKVNQFCFVMELFIQCLIRDFKLVVL